MPENPPVPIVFLPGVMGSRLYFENSRKYWDPDHRGRMLEWVPIPLFRSADALRQQMHAREPAGVLIDHDQPPEEIDAAARERGWGSVAWGFYGAFLKDLQSLAPAAAPVYAVGYDWRQDHRWLGRYVREKVDRIRTLLGARAVIVITHSMGGLVARTALAQDPTLAGRVRGVLHICQPAHGAVVLYRRFFTGVDPRYDVEASLADKVFRLILGGDAADFTAKMSGLPGPMQLLPGPHFPAGPAGPWNSFLASIGDGGSLYDLPRRPPGLALDDLAADVRADLQARVAELLQFQQHLGGVGHPQTWAIYGIGLPTDVGIAFDDRGNPVPRRTNEGDGTVPAASGSGLFDRRGEVFHPSLDLDQHRLFLTPNVSHAEACNHQTVRDVSRRIVTRLLGLPRPVSAPEGPPIAAFGMAAARPGNLGAVGPPADVPFGLPQPVKDIKDGLIAALQGFARRLGEVVDDATALEVATYVSDRMSEVRYENGAFANASVRALTRVKLDGDTLVCAPMTDGKVDDSLWKLHLEMVERAQVHRAEMVKVAVEATKGILEGLRLV